MFDVAFVFARVPQMFTQLFIAKPPQQSPPTRAMPCKCSIGYPAQVRLSLCQLRILWQVVIPTITIKNDTPY